jgi:hypothetical protein
MVVWRIEGDEIGPNGAAASFHATKLEAERALREHRDFNIKILRKRRQAHGDENEGSYQPSPSDFGEGPFRVVIKNRAQLCDELNAVTGYGCT